MTVVSKTVLCCNSSVSFLTNSFLHFFCFCDLYFPASFPVLFFLQPPSFHHSLITVALSLFLSFTHTHPSHSFSLFLYVSLMSVTAELWVVDGYCSKVMFLLSFISVLKLYLVIVYVNIVEKAFAFCFFCYINCFSHIN